MFKIRYLLMVLAMMYYSIAPAKAEVSIGIGIGFPNVSIGFNLNNYPELVPVPGYPVYYAPRLQANYFFYDGMYWIYQDDNWYDSAWYNGPWWLVDPEDVPEYVLRIPVGYYRLPPLYFRGWISNAPPHWGEHWGHDWDQRRSGWDRWNRGSVPAPAPLPDFQRRFSGDTYPRKVEQQHELQNKNYGYQPRDPVVQQHKQKQTAPVAPAQQSKPQQERPKAPEDNGAKQQGEQRATQPHQQTKSQPPERSAAPRPTSPQTAGKDVQQKPATPSQQGRAKVQGQKPPPQQGAAQQKQPSPKKAPVKKEKQPAKDKEDKERDAKPGQDRGQNRN